MLREAVARPAAALLRWRGHQFGAADEVGCDLECHYHPHAAEAVVERIVIAAAEVSALEHPLRGVASLDEVLRLLELLLEHGQVVGELVLDAQLDA